MTKSIFTQTRWLVTIILLIVFAVPKVWAGTSASATFKSSGTMSTAITTAGSDLAVTSSSIPTGWNSGAPGWLCDQPSNTVTLTSTTFSSKYITKVSVTCKRTKSKTITASVTVGGNAYGGDAQVTEASTSYNTLEFEDAVGKTGNIVITLTSPGGSATADKGSLMVSDITIIYENSPLASCSVNPSATGDASINGSFTLTSLTDAVSVSSGTWGPGSNCSWTDYGFVWGTSSSLSTDNNKVQVGTTGNATSWATDASHKVQPSGSTDPTSWSVGTTYYVKAYGKNGKAGATYYYSTNAESFTLRSITYNSNGGSTVNTQYVNSGGTYSEPSAPTKDGYTFSNWCTNSTLTADMDWTAAISENKSLYAKWTANPYTISLDNQSATTPGDASISVTYDSNTNLTGTPAITVPKKTGYTFGGYYTSTGGSGDQIIDADGNVVASVSGYTSATKQWIYAGNKTLYAKWTIKNYTITWKVNGETWTPKTTTGEGTDGSDNANYNTAWSTLTLPTDPGASELTSCVADKCMGWTESENYESDSAPTDLLNSSNKASKTSKKITKNTTFYAVFADYGE